MTKMLCESGRYWVLCLIMLSSFCRGQSPDSSQVRYFHNGLQTIVRKTHIGIQFFAEDTVRVVKWPEGGTSQKDSLIVVQKELPKLNITLQESPDKVILSSGRLIVHLSLNTGVIHFFNAQKQLIANEQGRAAITPIAIPHETKAYSVSQDFKLRDDEGIYGLGQHQDGVMNYRGKTVKLVQANTAAVTPFLISTAGYGLLWDNYSATLFTESDGRMTLWSEVGDNVDYYFIAGDTMDRIIAGYRNLTGRAPMYGKWAYGYWQSKEHYKNRDELLGVAGDYRKRQIPIDNIIQDWNYWGSNSNWGSMSFDPTKYPNPKEMVDLLHGMNFHLMISIWPGFGPDTAIFKEMDKKGFLYNQFGWAGFKYYDAYNPKANDLYWKYLNEGLYSQGIDGWWMDSTEPDVVNALTKEGTDAWMKRIGTHHRGSFARYMNPYSLVMTESVYQKQRKESDRQRVYILTRSAFAGQQRAAATTWSGDIGASWEIYRKQIPAGINHCMSGIPYWTFDIGGFVLGSYGGVFSNGGKDPAYQELYARMFQFGAFCPIFRAHGSETPREIWEFGEYTDMMIKFDNLRYRLMPYIYSTAWRITNDGYTMMRGLPMDFSTDTKTLNIDDQFMFGPAIMVCPVTEYMVHRPPQDSILITPEHFKTKDGQPGLDVTYYSDTELKTVCRKQAEPDINLFWYTGWPDFIDDATFSMRWEGKLIPTQTGAHRFHLKSFGPKKVYLDGKEVPCNYTSVEFYTVGVDLQADKEYDFAFETSNAAAGAFRAQLYWKTPEIHAAEKTVENKAKTRPVYLPAQIQWTDFWTGQTHQGGQAITADAPMEKIPLLVRAGSIIPLGPLMQYATEKPADPIELRIYPGADGQFTLYEDENDGYNYEKGVFAIIDFKWDDAKRQLTIGQRVGKFPGMLQQRTLHIVLVGKDHGIGINTTLKADKVISYDGKQQVVQM